MRISDWSSDVCSSDLIDRARAEPPDAADARGQPCHLRHELLVARLACKRDADREHGLNHRRARRYMDRAIVEKGTRAAPGTEGLAERGKIGRASCRERGCQYV